MKLLITATLLLLAMNSYGKDNNKSFFIKKQQGIYEKIHFINNSILVYDNGCRGYNIMVLDHDIENEIKFEVKSSWSLSHDFFGRELKKKEELTGKVFIFKISGQEILSISNS